MVYNNDFVVVIKCNGKVLRERKDVVYLPFGSEYSILLKNLSTRKALVDVEIDGESVIKGKLIIDSNSSLELKRYVKSMKKGNRFKFIKKTDKISDYRGDRVDDGIVRVTYQFEKPVQCVLTYTDYSSYYYKPCPHNAVSCVYPSRWSCSGCPYYSNIRVEWGQPWSYYYSSSDITYSNSTIATDNVDDGVMEISCNVDNNEATEEGITVPGGVSDQEFISGNIGEVENEVYVINILIKGKVAKDIPVVKPVTVKSKISCNICGRTNSSRFSYCTECGSALLIY